MLSLHYFPSVSGVGLARIYLVVVGVALYCVLLAVVVILTPFMFSWMLYSADVATARPRLRIAVTVCQVILFAVCCIVGAIPLTWWIQVPVAFCALSLMCSAIAWVWFVGDHQLRSWGYRTFYICGWSTFGLVAVLTLRPAIFAEQVEKPVGGGESEMDRVVDENVRDDAGPA
jgi:hypothetical protein